MEMDQEGVVAGPMLTVGSAASATPLRTPQAARIGHGWSLKFGDRLDCRDLEGYWCLAEVKEETEERVFIHFIDWSKLWDLWIFRSDSALQPIHSKTGGKYSGPTEDTTEEELNFQLSYEQRIECAGKYESDEDEDSEEPSCAQREFMRQLHSIAPPFVSIQSIKRRLAPRSDTDFNILIKNHTNNTIVDLDDDGLIIDGEPLFIASIDSNDSNRIQFRGKYIYQYAAADEEYQAEVEEVREKYAVDISHCQKLLNDLPMALSNSQQKLTEQMGGEDVELAELGALVLEQDRISSEIKRQKAILASLPPVIDQSKFKLYQFQPAMPLSFGWHQLHGPVYEIIRLQPKVELHFDPSVGGESNHE